MNSLKKATLRAEAEKILAGTIAKRPMMLCEPQQVIDLLDEARASSAREDILIAHMAEIYAHAMSPGGKNPDQPMSVLELCNHCLKELEEGASRDSRDG